jgi:hypothetical protein
MHLSILMGRIATCDLSDTIAPQVIRLNPNASASTEMGGILHALDRVKNDSIEAMLSHQAATF